MDNATLHRSQLQLKNVKIIFFPANTISHCQPLYQGIIQKFKVHYRCMLLTRIFLEIDKCDSADKLTHIVIVLDAIMWVETAEREIK